MLLAAIILITSALVAYSIGVWAEHRARILKPWHAGMFALGLTCDASGTWLMSRIAAAHGDVTGVLTHIMAWTGALALLLMVFHLGWALVVLVRHRIAEKETFHRFSLAVWGFWLIPYVTGMAGSMIR